MALIRNLEYYCSRPTFGTKHVATALQVNVEQKEDLLNKS
jgi:hypothetical protein